MCVEIGFPDVVTLLQSGNLVLEGGRRSAGALERLLKAEVAKRLKVATAFMVRSATEWADIVAGNPFPKEARSDPSHLMVMALKEPFDPGRFKALRRTIAGPERIALRGREIYVTYPKGSAGSSLERSRNGGSSAGSAPPETGTRC